MAARIQSFVVNMLAMILEVLNAITEFTELKSAKLERLQNEAQSLHNLLQQQIGQALSQRVENLKSRENALYLSSKDARAASEKLRSQFGNNLREQDTLWQTHKQLKIDQQKIDQEMSAVSAQMEEVQNQLDSAAAEVAEKRNSFTYSLQSAFNFSKTSDQNDANVYQTLMEKKLAFSSRHQALKNQQEANSKEIELAKTRARNLRDQADDIGTAHWNALKNSRALEAQYTEAQQEYTNAQQELAQSCGLEALSTSGEKINLHPTNLTIIS
ncbi:hypothetical protein [Candidatus Glomeribacter gigasporarum]|nr:hypothetical protein [Candidatus Glomeribacter gigasporarum]